jgi:hypothetical protein
MRDVWTRFGRGRATLHRRAADELAHHRVTAQPVGIVDVLIAGKAREDRLAEQPGETAPAVPRVADQPGGQVGQAEGVIQLPLQEQTAVGADGGAAKRQLHRAVELEPQRAGLRLTRRVRRRHADPPPSTRCYREDITVWRESEA